METVKNKFILAALLTSVAALPAAARELNTNMALMQAMDKVTGKVSEIKVPVNGEVQFGTFSIVVRDCKTRSAEETPENFAFVDVADSDFDKNQVNIFKGWMISSSPALNAVEHPIYDVWLLKCVNEDVSAKKLLGAEELALRDSMPKRSELKPDEKIKAKFVPAAEPAVKAMAEPVEMKADAVPEVSEEVIEIKEDMRFSPNSGEEGAPQALFNFEEPTVNMEEVADENGATEEETHEQLIDFSSQMPEIEAESLR